MQKTVKIILKIPITTSEHIFNITIPEVVNVWTATTHIENLNIPPSTYIITNFNIDGDASNFLPGTQFRIFEHLKANQIGIGEIL